MSKLRTRAAKPRRAATLAAAQGGVFRIKDAEGRTVELTPEQVVKLAIELHRNGGLEQAETMYRAVIELKPDHPDALHFLGVLRHQNGDTPAALELIERSLELAPDNPGMWGNYGNVLVDAGRVDEAMAAYRRSLALAPRQPGMHNNLGIALRALRRFDESRAEFDRALEIAPDFADAHHNLGNLLSAQGRIAEAVESYYRAITLKPDSSLPRQMLGHAYCRLGQFDKAKPMYEQWLAEEPDNPAARHLLAACTGEGVPERAADDFVVDCFDRFAESFDAKLHSLEYRAPQLVDAMLKRLIGEAASGLAILDAGCGTGLCGPLLAPHAARLVGVDLSAGMLAKARLRGVYDELAKEELTAFLGRHDGAFDTIVSADTLVYFGALEAVCEAAETALRAGGSFVFTVEDAGSEAPAEAGYRLDYHGRFSHRRDYVERTLREAGFDRIEIEPAALRMESGLAVHGLVVGAQRPSGRYAEE